MSAETLVMVTTGAELLASLDWGQGCCTPYSVQEGPHKEPSGTDVHSAEAKRPRPS